MYSEKCGCSAIKYWFLYQVGDENYNDATNIHYIASKYITTKPGNPKYMIVRNPIDRIISTYREKIANKNNKWYYTGESLEDFTTSILKQDVVDMDVHWRPQSVLAGEHIPDEIFRYETGLQSILDSIGKRHKLNKVILPILNPSPNVDVKITDKALKNIYTLYHNDFVNYYPELL